MTMMIIQSVKVLCLFLSIINQYSMAFLTVPERFTTTGSSTKLYECSSSTKERIKVGIVGAGAGKRELYNIHPDFFMMIVHL